jgi:hypothetical protein
MSLCHLVRLFAIFVVKINHYRHKGFTKLQLCRRVCLGPIAIRTTHEVTPTLFNTTQSTNSKQIAINPSVAKRPKQSFSAKCCCKVSHGFCITYCILVFYKKIVIQVIHPLHRFVDHSPVFFSLNFSI